MIRVTPGWGYGLRVDVGDGVVDTAEIVKVKEQTINEKRDYSSRRR
jgi:hypothetical protein